MKKAMGFVSVCVSLALIIIVAGCGGGGSSSTPATTTAAKTVSGTAETVTGSSIAASRVVGRSAAAATDGLVYVAVNTAVYAKSINEDGTLGGTLASGVIVSNGSFSLTLPISVQQYVSSYVIVIGSGTDEIRSFMTGDSVSVNPITEYVVDEVVGDTSTSLADFSVTELSEIYTEVTTELENQSFTFTSVTTVTAAISAINAVAATTIATSITDASGNDTAEALCGTIAMAYVETAKAKLFQSSISETDFDAAQSAITSALTASSSCPDANLLGAIIDIVDELDRMGSEALATPEEIFPLNNVYNAGSSLGRVTSAVIDNLPRKANAGTLDENSKPSDWQSEIYSNALNVFLGAQTKLTTARTAIASYSDTWAFSYPIDPSNTSLGYQSLDANDVDVLYGALEIVVGSVYYALAYNLDLPSGYSTTDPCPINKGTWVYNGSTYVYEEQLDDSYSALSGTNTCSAADVDSNGTLTPSEYLPGDSTFGTLTSSGATYLSNAKSRISNGFSVLNSAITDILAEANSTVGGMNMQSAMINDVEQYQHFVSELATSFGGTATSITIPKTDECWASDGTNYSSTKVFDPDYNTSAVANCAFQITVDAAKTASINFGALFSITDFRNALPDSSIDTSGEVSTVIIGETFGGVFPNGVQSSWFESKSLLSGFVYLYDATTMQAITGLTTTDVSITVDSKTITPYYVYSSYSSYAQFGHDYSELPTADDYVTLNDMEPTTVTLNVTGYEAKTFEVSERYFYQSLYLTAQ